jgi:hypothetical protein
MVTRFGHISLRLPRFARPISHGIRSSALLFLCSALMTSLVAGVSLAGGIPCADNPDAVCYGDFMGSTVTYRMVREEATTIGDVAPLFGMPTVGGDSLDFDPVGFSASAAGVGGVDITESTLAFMVEAKPGSVIQTIKFDEAGDTTLIGGAGLAFTAVSADVNIDIEQVDGMSITPIKLNGLEMMFTPSNGDYLLGTDGAFPMFDTIWTGTLSVNIEQALMDNNVPFVGGATKISVILDNTLSAMSANGTQSVIAKKDNGLIVTTGTRPDPGGGPEIPEPASCCLAMLGLAVGATLTRRSPR